MIKEELIIKYLSNQTDSQESILVSDWAAENPKDFQLFREIWEESSNISEIQLFDTEKEWDSFMDLVSSETEETSKIISIKKNKALESSQPVSLWRELRPVALAASFLFIAFVAYFLFPKNEFIDLAAEKEDIEIVLPDSTLVYVNAGSKITYPSTFERKDKRVVYLEGIATFDITPDPNKPFIVETDITGIKALGTIFEVDASRKGLTGVSNKEGLIKFFEKVNEDNSIKVKEGESFEFDGSGFKETTPPPPVVKPVELPPEPEIVPLHSVLQIVNYMFTIANGHTVTRGDNFDWNKKIRIHLNTIDLDALIKLIEIHANLSLKKKDCSDCYEIHSFRIK